MIDACWAVMVYKGSLTIDEVLMSGRLLLWPAVYVVDNVPLRACREEAQFSENCIDRPNIYSSIVQHAVRHAWTWWPSRQAETTKLVVNPRRCKPSRCAGPRAHLWRLGPKLCGI